MQSNGFSGNCGCGSEPVPGRTRSSTRSSSQTCARLMDRSRVSEYWSDACRQFSTGSYVNHFDVLLVSASQANASSDRLERR